MMKVRKISHRGSNFEDYLAEEGLLDAVNATATQRVLVWQRSHAMKKRATKSNRDAG